MFDQLDRFVSDTFGRTRRECGKQDPEKDG